MSALQKEPEGAAALAKGLDLFRLILTDRGRTPITALAPPHVMPRTTLHRLLSELRRQGLVMRVERGRYDVGLVLAEAAATMTAHDQMTRAARRPLERLARRCGLTAHLGVFETDMVTYLVKAASAGIAADFTRENGQLEAYCSGLGKVLLAHLPAEARADYLASGPFVALTDRTITDPDLLQSQLAEIRRQGFAIDDGEIADGLRCFAVPVWRSEGRVNAAISVSASAENVSRIDDPDLRIIVLACAAEIGNIFGT